VNLATFIRRNPALVIGAAAIAGWALGSGLIPLPSLARSAPPATPTTPGVSGPSSSAPSQTSASMPPTAPPADPWAGYTS
jgi:hypothetical protein